MEKEAVKNAVLTRIGLTKAFYKKGLVRAAITKIKNMNLFAATITFLDNESENDLKFDYDSIILVQRCLGVEDTIKIIEDLIDRQVFIYDGVEIPVAGSWDETRFVPSRYRWGVLDCSNPRLYVSFRLQSPSPLPQYPLVLQQLNY
jgi:hypothetical protein